MPQVKGKKQAINPPGLERAGEWIGWRSLGRAGSVKIPAPIAEAGDHRSRAVRRIEGEGNEVAEDVARLCSTQGGNNAVHPEENHEDQNARGNDREDFAVKAALEHADPAD